MVKAGSRPLLGGLLALAALLVGGCASGDEPPMFEYDVEVVVREWSVEPAVERVPAGVIRFSVGNRGPASAHTFIVLRTDVPYAELPLVGDDPEAMQVNETQVEVVFELAEFFRGRAGITTLEAGQYVLICNKPGHYQRGMSAPFTVE